MIQYYCDRCGRNVVPELITELPERYSLYKISLHGAVRDELILCKGCQDEMKKFLTKENPAVEEAKK